MQWFGKFNHDFVYIENVKTQTRDNCIVGQLFWNKSSFSVDPQNYFFSCAKFGARRFKEILFTNDWVRIGN